MGDRRDANRPTLQTHEGSSQTRIQQTKNKREKAGLRRQAQENHKRQKNATMRHDDIPVKRPTRELKRLDRQIKPERPLS